MDNKYCLETTDYEENKVVFLEKTRQLKESKRPELRGKEGKKFINTRVKDTINKPEFVYEDLEFPDKRKVHYTEEFKINNKHRYTKVVMTRKGNPLEVITVFRPDYVKERGKTKLLFGEDKYENG